MTDKPPLLSREGFSANCCLDEMSSKILLGLTQLMLHGASLCTEIRLEMDLSFRKDRKALEVFQRHYLVMTSKNAADFVHFVMPEQAPASQNGQNRA
jgi:hypothetical protein